MGNSNLIIKGVPQGVSETSAAVLRTRLLRDVSEFIEETNIKDVEITVATSTSSRQKSAFRPESEDKSEDRNEFSVEKRAEQYKSQSPLYVFDQLVVSDLLKEELLSAVELVRVEPLVFDTWGLRAIEPFPRTALNFHGQPGTGKTLAAHAIANLLNRNILVASYAQIESKFHGEGPKNVEAIFYAAARDNAVLFMDEADSLLSKRLTDATQGSERAANSMCSQLLICLEKFRGIVIFATNLVENYDKAFETRVRHINFPLPDENARAVIWKRHLPDQLPLSKDVLIEELAKVDDICGREIKNAVIDAAVRTARAEKKHVELDELIASIDRIKAARIATSTPKTRKLSPEEEAKIKDQLRNALNKESQPSENVMGQDKAELLND